MPDLLTRPLLRRDEPAWGSRVPWFAAMVAAGWALVASLAMAVLPGVAVWIGDGAVDPASGPLRFGGWLWLAAHRVGLDVGGGDFAIAPLGLTIVFILLVHRSARWAAHSAGVSTNRGAIAVIVPGVLVYALGGGVVAAVSATPDVAAVPHEAVAWAGLCSLVVTTIGVAREADLLAEWFGLLPPPVRAGLAGGAVALAALLATGSLLTVISAVANAGRIGELASALDAGVLGGTVLAVGGAAIVPNGIVWAMSFSLGVGFSVGTGTSITPGGVELGLVPAVPALAALPDGVPGSLTWVVLVGPIAGGVLAGLVVDRQIDGAGGPGRPGGPDRSDDQRRSDGPGPRLAVAAAAGSGAVAAAGSTALSFLSGGSAGAARLTEIGPVPWHVGLAAFALVALPATATVAVTRYHRRRQDTRPKNDTPRQEDTPQQDDTPCQQEDTPAE